MRKHSTRTVRRACAPTVVALYINPEAGIAEQTSLLGIEQGWATPKQFNTLLDCADILMIAAADKGDKLAQDVAQMGRMALENISGRYRIKNKLGASGEELKALRAMVSFSDDWWNLQSGARFADAYFSLDRYRDWQRDNSKVTA